MNGSGESVYVSSRIFLFHLENHSSMAPEFLALEITISGVFSLSVSCPSGSISYASGLAFLLGMRTKNWQFGMCPAGKCCFHVLICDVMRVL